MKAEVVRFVAPGQVDVADEVVGAPGPREVVVQTLYSGISAGTELSAYRGTNPYLTRMWSPTDTLFVDGDGGLSYPLSGWGYSEVGRVIDAGEQVSTVQCGDVVWGIWGHRTHAVINADLLDGHVIPPGVDPRAGTFSRVAAVALNAVLNTQVGIGSVVAVVGLGVIGLLATRFAVLCGAEVIAVDPLEVRRDHAARWGAGHVLAPGPDLASHVRDLTAGRGADVAIELSGRDDALHEAIRLAGHDAVVVASGFYQGAASHVRLGEEFHHNRIRLQCSQIGSVPPQLAARWTRDRLVHAATARVLSGDPNVLDLVSHEFALHDAPQAYRMLDSGDPDALQVLLTMPGDQ